jgi:hypothetical protein
LPAVPVSILTKLALAAADALPGSSAGRMPIDAAAVIKASVAFVRAARRKTIKKRLIIGLSFFSLLVNDD